MRANPRVCVQTDEFANQLQWISVIANGLYEELPEITFAAERSARSSAIRKAQSMVGECPRGTPSQDKR
jgi:nitroimidazol reductase NimA-like FMN-containing flavoprotein (pyridoxamine 5'-phosphate oxidase superfamily)